MVALAARSDSSRNSLPLCMQSPGICEGSPSQLWIQFGIFLDLKGLILSFCRKLGAVMGSKHLGYPRRSLWQDDA